MELTRRSAATLNDDYYSWTETEVRLRDFIRKVAASDPFVDRHNDLSIPLNAIYSGPSLKWSTGWATDASVTILIDRKVVEHAGVKYAIRHIDCEIGWSSSRRNVTSAVAAMAMYQRAVEFAAVVAQSFCDDYWEVIE